MKNLVSVHQPADIISLKKPLILRPEHDATLQFLRQFLQSQLQDADEPWKLAHAILALGRDVTLQNGTGPIKEIFAKHARWKTIGQVDVVSFEKFSDGRTKKNPVEPHRDLLLKVITELNVISGMEIMVEGIPITLEDLLLELIPFSWIPSFNDRGCPLDCNVQINHLKIKITIIPIKQTTKLI